VDKKTLTLLLVVFIDLIGFGVVIPILPLLIERIGGNAFLVGVVISIFSLFQFLFSPILGRLSDKYGRRPILIASSAINAVSYFLIFISQAFWVIILGRILAGIGSSNLSVAQAYIADTSQAHERTKRMALVGAAFGLGFIVGPLLGGVVSEHFGIAAAFLIPALLAFANTILITIILPESNMALKQHVKIELFSIRVTREVLKPKNISFLLFLFFFVNLALALVIGVFPLYSENKFNWTESQNGIYFGLIGLGSLISQTALIRLLLKKFDESQMIIGGLVVFGLSVMLVGISPAAWFLLTVGPFTSVGFSLLNVNTQSLISLETKPEEQGAVMGVAQSFASLGRVFGPLLGGVIGTFNLSMPYVVSGILTLTILFFGQKYLRFMGATRKSAR